MAGYDSHVWSHVRAWLIAPDLLAAAPGWLPLYFAGATATALRAGMSGQSIGDFGGRIVEGWRASGAPGTPTFDPRVASTPMYRQSNIRELRLELAAQHWDSPQIEGPWCVRPGDIVVNKLAPVRAAYVSPAAKRHPADGSTLIVRDLSRATAVWLAKCLNQPGYSRLLLLGSGTLDRVGIKALESLRLPAAPPEMDGLSARLRDALDEQALTSEGMHFVRAEANEFACAGAAMSCSVRGGAFFAREAVNCESWLPTATALRAEQNSLAEDLGWAAIAELASWDDRSRLTQAHDGARVLRLRDVSEDLFVAPGDDAGEAAIPSRALAKPLVPGEVLISTLGSSFRTAYVDDAVPRNTFPADAWVRARFRETPAAWALLLSTDALRSQAARLAVGTVQQFVPPEALRSLRVPVPPREVRDRWQRAVERHHAQRRTQDHKWDALMAEMNAVFEAAHRPFAERRPRAREAAQ